MIYLLLLLASGSLTEEMWKAAQPVYAKTLQHPFLKGLADGSLKKSSFHFYLAEDAKYLRAFGQALNVIASKAPRQAWASTLNRHASEAIETEMQLHESLLKGIPRRDSPMAPSNYAYTNHLMATAERGTFAEGLAAVLPCYWIYWEVGKELKKRGSKDPDYRRWIDQYSDESYGKVVGEVLAMMNAEAANLTPAQRKRTVELFTTSARYEYLFWDMAYREEQWP